MPDRNRLFRREILGLLGASSLGVLGGCNGLPSGSDSSAEDDSAESPGTTTVVFTDATDEESSVSSIESDTRVFDGGDADAFAAALEALAANPGATLEITPGTYRFEPVREQQGAKWRHFNPPAMDEVTIEGNEATIIFTEPAAGGFNFDGGSDITIRNLTFDYDPVPFTQGVIQSISGDERTVEVVLDEGYPPLDHEMFEGISAPGGSVHTPDGEFVRGVRAHRHLDTYYTDISKIGERRYEMELTEDSTVQAIQTGLKQLFKARRDVQVFNFYQTDRPTLENVTIRASNGAGLTFGLGDNPVVRNCVIAPPTDSDRLIGTDADGIMFIDVESTPVLEDTRLEYVGDDPIVLQDTLSTVAEIIDDRTIRLGEWNIVAQPGDTLRALSQRGERKGPLPLIEAVEYRQGSNIGRGKPETITFEASISDTLSASDLLGNQATACHDFVVRNNTVRNVRGNLTRIAASHGVVEGNTLEGSHRNGIEVECDTNDSVFAPTGGVVDIAIRNNDISRPGLNYRAGHSPSGIRVHHFTRGGITTEGLPNKDITIEGNRIENGAYLGIEIEDAAEVQIRGNDLHDLNQLDYPETGKYGVVLDRVRTGSVIGNLVTGSAENLMAFGIQRRSTNIEAADNEMEIDGESRSARLISFDPVSLSFDKTVTPPSGDRVLAFRCFELSLLDASGEPIVEIDIGTDETAFEAGQGVYDVDEEGSERWRWFGGESATSTMYLYGHHLDQARTLRLEGNPVEGGITGTVSVAGQVTDTVDFGPTERQVYEISLVE